MPLYNWIDDRWCRIQLDPPSFIHFVSKGEFCRNEGYASAHKVCAVPGARCSGCLCGLAGRAVVLPKKSTYRQSLMQVENVVPYSRPRPGS